MQSSNNPTTKTDETPATEIKDVPILIPSFESVNEALDAFSKINVVENLIDLKNLKQLLIDVNNLRIKKDAISKKEKILEDKYDSITTQLKSWNKDEKLSKVSINNKSLADVLKLISSSLKNPKLIPPDNFKLILDFLEEFSSVNSVENITNDVKEFFDDIVELKSIKDNILQEENPLESNCNIFTGQLNLWIQGEQLSKIIIDGNSLIATCNLIESFFLDPRSIVKENFELADDLLNPFKKVSLIKNISDSLLELTQLNYKKFESAEEEKKFNDKYNKFIEKLKSWNKAWNQGEKFAQIMIDRTSLIDILYQTALVLANLNPINLIDSITLCEIPATDRIVTSDRYQFDAESLFSTLVNNPWEPLTNFSTRQEFNEKDKLTIFNNVQLYLKRGKLPFKLVSIDNPNKKTETDQSQVIVFVSDPKLISFCNILSANNILTKAYFSHLNHFLKTEKELNTNDASDIILKNITYLSEAGILIPDFFEAALYGDLTSINNIICCLSQANILTAGNYRTLLENRRAADGINKVVISLLDLGLLTGKNYSTAIDNIKTYSDYSQVLLEGIEISSKNIKITQKILDTFFQYPKNISQLAFCFAALGPNLLTKDNVKLLIKGPGNAGFNTLDILARNYGFIIPTTITFIKLVDIGKSLRNLSSAGLLNKENYDLFMDFEDSSNITKAINVLKSANLLTQPNFLMVAKSSEHLDSIVKCMEVMHANGILLDDLPAIIQYHQDNSAPDIAKGLKLLSEATILNQDNYIKLLENIKKIHTALARLSFNKILTQENFNLLIQHPEISIDISSILINLKKNDLLNPGNITELIKNVSKIDMIDRGVDLLDFNSLMTRENYTAFVQRNLEEGNAALEIMTRLKQFDELSQENYEALGENPSLVKDAVNRLANEDILTTDNYRLILQKPHDASELAEGLVFLKAIGLSTPENIAVLANNANNAQLAALEIILKDVGLFTDENLKLLKLNFNHAKEIINIIFSLKEENIVSETNYLLLFDNLKCTKNILICVNLLRVSGILTKDHFKILMENSQFSESIVKFLSSLSKNIVLNQKNFLHIMDIIHNESVAENFIAGVETLNGFYLKTEENIALLRQFPNDGKLFATALNKLEFAKILTNDNFKNLISDPKSLVNVARIINELSCFIDQQIFTILLKNRKDSSDFIKIIDTLKTIDASSKGSKLLKEMLVHITSYNLDAYLKYSKPILTMITSLQEIKALSKENLSLLFLYNIYNYHEKITSIFTRLNSKNLFTEQLYKTIVVNYHILDKFDALTEYLNVAGLLKQENITALENIIENINDFSLINNCIVKLYKNGILNQEIYTKITKNPRQATNIADGLIFLKISNGFTPENYAKFLLDPNIEELTTAFGKLNMMGILTLENITFLLQNPTHANDVADGLLKLSQAGILTPVNRAVFLNNIFYVPDITSIFQILDYRDSYTAQISFDALIKHIHSSHKISEEINLNNDNYFTGKYIFESIIQKLDTYKMVQKKLNQVCEDYLKQRPIIQVNNEIFKNQIKILSDFFKQEESHLDRSLIDKLKLAKYEYSSEKVGLKFLSENIVDQPSTLLYLRLEHLKTLIKLYKTAPKRKRLENSLDHNSRDKICRDIDNNYNAYLGEIKRRKIDCLSQYLSEDSDPEDIIKTCEKYLSDEQTFEILMKNRQSSGERFLKILSVIGILAGIGIFTTAILMIKRLHDTHGSSANFFKPRTQNLHKDMTTLISSNFSPRNIRVH